MRYGKVRHKGWTLEFRFNWKENRYDVIAYHANKGEVHSETGKRIGAVWKDPRKSRQRPCWSAIHEQGKTNGTLNLEFPQMREAGLALLDLHISPNA